MQELKSKFEDFLEKIKQYFVGDDQPEGRKKLAIKKWLNLILITLFILVSFTILLTFLMSEKDSDQNLSKISKEKDLKDSHKKLELATDVTKGEVKWQNFLEESIESEERTRKEQIDILKNSLSKNQEVSKKEIDHELDELKMRLSYALGEIDRLKLENQDIMSEVNSLSPDQDNPLLPAELGLTAINAGPTIKPPMSSFNHIPATGYVNGHVVGGIAVSTSVNTAAEPIPVMIKLTNRGNLPRKFAVNIEECNILASCYGDISSERAVIRADELVCEDKAAGLLTITKVSGVIYGDDGGNGIRGTVVSMSDKHLKNAFIGSILSGFSNTAKSQAGLNITPLGAVSTKKRDVKDIAQDGLLNGTSNAAEKLADYHIKLAENISPVILIPGGTEVSVMFTKSVEIGSMDIEQKINEERVGQ